MLEKGGQGSRGTVAQHNIYDLEVFGWGEEAGRVEEEKVVGFIMNFICI